MAGSSAKVNRGRSALLAAALGAFAAWLFYRHASPALGAWFYREDSRFFANGIFSVYDLWTTFSTPVNSMQQYRPVTKLYWGLPHWLGAFDPVTYHWVTLALVGLTGATLARLAFLFCGNVPVAMLAGGLYVLLPVHVKPLYWASAVHNTAVAFFVCAAIALRIEWWRGGGGPALRVAGLLACYLAIASREVAFCLAPILLWIDYSERRTMRRSWDFALLTCFFLWYLFLLKPPFDGGGGVQVHLSRLAAPAELASILWNYAEDAFWLAHEAGAGDTSPLWKSVICALALLSSLALPFFRRSFFTVTLLTWLGIAPFLLVNTNPEYASVMALGSVLALTLPAALLLSRAGRLGLPIGVALVLAVLPAYSQVLWPLRELHQLLYVERSQELRRFVEKLGAFSAGLPPYRLVHIHDFGPYVKGVTEESHHFLDPGLAHLLPARRFLFTGEELGGEAGIGGLAPDAPLLKGQFPGLAKPVRIRYDGERFEVTR